LRRGVDADRLHARARLREQARGPAVAAAEVEHALARLQLHGRDDLARHVAVLALELRVAPLLRPPIERLCGLAHGFPTSLARIESSGRRHSSQS
jgi:hypothetical protein